MNPVITSAKTFHRTIMYNFEKVDRGVGSVLYTQGISPHSYEMAMESLRPFIEMEARTRNRVFSCSLNPHPDDKVDDELFVKLAREWMQEMGYGEQPYIVFKHWDIERHHIHIIAPRIDWTGKKIKDSWEAERARRIADKLERKYGLKVTGNYPTIDDEELRPLKPIDPKEGDLKKQMAEVVLQALPHLYFQSLGELNCLLAKYNITTEPTKTEYKGKYYDGLVYIATDSMGNKIGPPIKGSELGRGCGIYALRNRMKRSQATVEMKAGLIRFAIKEAQRTTPSSLREYEKRLQRLGIDLVVRMNEEGRIYGVTYVDHEEGVAINGSRLGKEYSANAFNRVYGTGTPLRPEMQPSQAPSAEQILTLEQSNSLADFIPDYLGNDFEGEIAERRFQQRVKREERERKWKYRTRKRK